VEGTTFLPLYIWAIFMPDQVPGKSFVTDGGKKGGLEICQVAIPTGGKCLCNS